MILRSAIPTAATDLVRGRSPVVFLGGVARLNSTRVVAVSPPVSPPFSTPPLPVAATDRWMKSVSGIRGSQGLTFPLQMPRRLDRHEVRSEAVRLALRRARPVQKWDLRVQSGMERKALHVTYVKQLLSLARRFVSPTYLDKSARRGASPREMRDPAVFPLHAQSNAISRGSRECQQKA